MSSKERGDADDGTEPSDEEAVEGFEQTLKRMLDTPPSPRKKRPKEKHED